MKNCSELCWLANTTIVVRTQMILNIPYLNTYYLLWYALFCLFVIFPIYGNQYLHYIWQGIHLNYILLLLKFNYVIITLHKDRKNHFCFLQFITDLSFKTFWIIIRPYVWYYILVWNSLWTRTLNWESYMWKTATDWMSNINTHGISLGNYYLGSPRSFHKQQLLQKQSGFFCILFADQ